MADSGQRDAPSATGESPGTPLKRNLEGWPAKRPAQEEERRAGLGPAVGARPVTPRARRVSRLALVLLLAVVVGLAAVAAPLVFGAGRQSARVSASEPEPSPPPASPIAVPAGLTTDLSKALVQLPSGTSWPTGAVVNEEDGSVLVEVPAGEAIFGSPQGEGVADEHPQFRLSLPAYYIGVTEVTNAQYRRFVEATGREAPQHWANGTIPNGLDNHPVVNVSWEDAAAYCEWARGRLPTELEWEKAARGTDGRIYPWGDEWDPSKCRNTFNGELVGQETAPVGSYPSGASPYGVLDMTGNVWEWCSDWYDEAAYARYASGDLTPPPSGRCRVLRGGSWALNALSPRAACRGGAEPSGRKDRDGFRLAKAL